MPPPARSTWAVCVLLVNFLSTGHGVSVSNGTVSSHDNGGLNATFTSRSTSTNPPRTSTALSGSESEAAISSAATSSSSQLASLGDWIASGLGFSVAAEHDPTSQIPVNAISPTNGSAATVFDSTYTQSHTRLTPAANSSAALNNSSYTGDCWAQWNQFWKLNGSSTIVETSELYTGTEYTYYTSTLATPTPTTVTLSFGSFAWETVTALETIIFEDDPTTTYTEWITAYDTFPAYPGLTTPPCALPTSIPQCQSSWENWASHQPLANSLSFNSSLSCYYTATDSACLAQSADEAAAYASWNSAADAPAPACSQARITGSLCSGLVSSYTKVSRYSEFDDFTWDGGSSMAPGCTVGCATCRITGATVELIFWPPKTAGNGNASTDFQPGALVTATGFNTTFTSPTVYISFDSLYASDSCSGIGATFLNTIIPIAAPSRLSSIYGWNRGGLLASASFNFTDLVVSPVPDSIYNSQPYCASLAGVSNNNAGNFGWSRGPFTCNVDSEKNYRPILAVPEEVRGLDPKWASCIGALDGVYDPPYGLRPNTAIAKPSLGPDPVVTTTAEPAPTAPSGPSRTEPPAIPTLDPAPAPAQSAALPSMNPPQQSSDPGVDDPPDPADPDDQDGPAPPPQSPQDGNVSPSTSSGQAGDEVPTDGQGPRPEDPAPAQPTRPNPGEGNAPADPPENGQPAPTATFSNAADVLGDALTGAGAKATAGSGDPASGDKGNGQSADPGGASSPQGSQEDPNQGPRPGNSLVSEQDPSADSGSSDSLNAGSDPNSPGSGSPAGSQQQQVPAFTTIQADGKSYTAMQDDGNVVVAMGGSSVTVKPDQPTIFGSVAVSASGQDLAIGGVTVEAPGAGSTRVVEAQEPVRFTLNGEAFEASAVDGEVAVAANGQTTTVALGRVATVDGHTISAMAGGGYVVADGSSTVRVSSPLASKDPTMGGATTWITNGHIFTARRQGGGIVLEEGGSTITLPPGGRVTIAGETITVPLSDPSILVDGTATMSMPQSQATEVDGVEVFTAGGHTITASSTEGSVIMVDGTSTMTVSAGATVTFEGQVIVLPTGGGTLVVGGSQMVALGSSKPTGGGSEGRTTSTIPTADPSTPDSGASHCDAMSSTLIVGVVAITAYMIL